jgi:hypothetical protein
LSRAGIDIDRFETAFDRNLYPNLGLSRGMRFWREHFGVDKLVTRPRRVAPTTCEGQAGARWLPSPRRLSRFEK